MRTRKLEEIMDRRDVTSRKSLKVIQTFDEGSFVVEFMGKIG
jgi:hypothetical protein